MPPPNGKAEDAKKYVAKTKKTATKSWTQKTRKISNDTGPVGRGSTNYNTTKSDTGTNYVNGTYKPFSVPTSKAGMLLAALNPMNSFVSQGAKAFWNQKEYGMNDEARKNYDVVKGLPENADKSLKELITLARQPQIDAQLPHAFIDGNPTTDIQKQIAAITGGKAPTSSVYHADGSINIAATAATATDGSGSQFAVDPNSGEVVDVAETEEKFQLGTLPNSMMPDRTGENRPDWAPDMNTSETGGDYDPYAPMWNQPQQPQQPPQPEYQPRQAPQPQYDQGMLTQQPQAPQAQAYQSQLAPQAQGTPEAYQAQGTPEAYQSQGTPEAYQSQGTPEAYQQSAAPTGAPIPTQAADSGTFTPVTFRSGTGTSATTQDGMTTNLNAPYAGLSDLVGQGTGLLGQAATQAQGAADQFNGNINTDQRAQDLFSQRSELLQPAFAQQNAQARESMFGSGRLGLRLAGEGVGAGNGMVQPDAFGINQAQSQALAGLAAQSSTDAFNQGQAQQGLNANAFNMNQQAQQQRFANLQGAGQGMLSAGLQGAQLESSIAQQQLQNQQNQQAQGLSQQRLNLDALGQSQNFGLAQRGQQQDYGLSRDQFGLSAQGQAQNFGLARDQFGLASRGQAQEYGLSRDRFGLAQQTQDQANAMANQRMALDTLANSQLDARGNRGMDINQQGQQQNFGLAQQAQNQANALSQGRLSLDTLGQSQGYGLQQQQQMQDYGLNQQKMDLATQQQRQDYGMGMLTADRNYGLSRDALAQNYELDTERNKINMLTGQAAANRDNYQPNPWLAGGVAAGSAFLGTDTGADWLSNLFT